MNGISAFIPVFNEEKRIKHSLNSLSWCDEIVVLDKQSQDKTRSICEEMNAKVFEINEGDGYNANEFSFLKENCKYDWVILFTASDIIHPELAKEIRGIIDKDDLSFDFISIPYRNYVLGIGDKYSPWFIESKIVVFRKSALKINYQAVHNALVFDENRTFKIHPNKNQYLFHLTHENIDILMDRHLRYWRGEANELDYSLKKAFRNVLGAIKKTLINRTFFNGKAGVALAFAYISYFLMSYVYRWDKKYNYADKRYNEIRNNISRLWDNTKI